jgi:hypothetical protein
MERLKSVMSGIPVDDLFDATDRASDCLVDWAAQNLELSRDQSRQLISALQRSR